MTHPAVASVRTGLSPYQMTSISPISPETFPAQFVAAVNEPGRAGIATKAPCVSAGLVATLFDAFVPAIHSVAEVAR
jgi:hypothetical protein